MPDRKTVVLLVDDRKRDLLAAGLLSLQLERHGLACQLEPLEAYRGVLAAHRPAMIVFNHMTSSHVVAYSQRLKGMGIQTAVVLNEGLCYDEEERIFNAQKHHGTAHINLFFCWNELLKAALAANSFDRNTRIEAVGCARHDLFFPPWSRTLASAPTPRKRRPRLLVTTHMAIADFHYLPQGEVDKFFAPWTKRISNYRNYNELVASQHRARQAVFPFLDALARAGEFALTVRPHPRENTDRYRPWLAALPAEARPFTQVDNTTNFTTQVLDCDLLIGCEDCTSILDAWVAGKPAIALELDKNPVFYHPEIAGLNPTCGRAEDLVPLARAQLADPDQAKFQVGRRQHLATWCGAPSGRTTDVIAARIAESLAGQPEPDWAQLTAADQRRAFKLRSWRALDRPYHYNPIQAAKALISDRHLTKLSAIRKSIRPSDVAEVRRLLSADATRT
jgi:surface carbohydrate biosynthesis protein